MFIKFLCEQLQNLEELVFLLSSLCNYLEIPRRFSVFKLVITVCIFFRLFDPESLASPRYRHSHARVSADFDILLPVGLAPRGLRKRMPFPISISKFATSSLARCLVSGAENYWVFSVYWTHSIVRALWRCVSSSQPFLTICIPFDYGFGDL